MNQKNLLFYLIILLFAVSVSAQESASVNWQLNEADSQKVSAVEGKVLGINQTASLGFKARDYKNGPGPDQRWYPYEDDAAVKWGNETAQNNNRWIQFAVTPIESFTFSVDQISLYIGAKGTDKVRANVSYSLDTSFTDATMLNSQTLILKKDNDSLYTFTLSQEVTDQDTLYLRVYPWYEGSPSTSKYLYLRNATISGTTKGDLFPASALWELTDPDDGGTGLSAVTAGQVLAKDEYFPKMVINKYTGPENSQRLKIDEWPANQTNQIDSVYIQFEVAPRPGLEFTAKSISLDIAAVSINTMKANIAYSLDSSFSESFPVEYFSGDTLNNYLNRDTLTPVQADINLKVPAGGSFYLRVYPWVDNDPAVRTGKYICLQNVLIEGEIEGNFVPEVPSVETKELSFIGVDFATSGGNVITDGGAKVTSRGVVWNKNGNPTILDSLTLDGDGPGGFTSKIMNLEKGTTYYMRAYAENLAGISYGDELVFSTLDSIIVPTVETADASNILVKSAESGGNVISWGGSEVLMRGVCWNKTGNPTVEDEHTENGAGLGEFESIMYPLESVTTYYVRAYAQNIAGIGYGEVDTVVTQEPAPEVLKVVAQDGSGDYTTVQAAFDDIPDFYTGEYTIFVTEGTYYEKLFLDRNKTNVVLQGSNPETTILTYDDYAAIAGGTSKSYSVGIDADDFTAINITFQNTYQNDGSTDGQQAVALRVNGDRQSYYNCRLLGYQDTYYTWGGRGTQRTYMKKCYIEGSIDFIFGRNIVVFDSCQINVNRDGCTITAASTEEDSKFGYVFRDCIISADSIGFNGEEITSISLGRPWQAAPRTVYMNTYQPKVLDPMGWTYWNVTPALYAEYNCYGPGYSIFRAAFATRLSDEEAAEYTLENIFSKESDPGLAYDWMPEDRVITDVNDDLLSNSVPNVFKLDQNYPNPFNPSTTIKYQIAKEGKVQLVIYNMLGQRITTLVNNYQTPGKYQVNFNARALASGLYIYRLETESFIQTKKMLLLK